MDNTNAFAHKLSEVLTTVSFLFDAPFKKQKIFMLKKNGNFYGIFYSCDHTTSCYISISACVFNNITKRLRKETQWSLQSHWLDRSVLSDIWLAWQCQSEAYHSDPLPEGARTD
mgnify:CR=1 FL=1